MSDIHNNITRLYSQGEYSRCLKYLESISVTQLSLTQRLNIKGLCCKNLGRLREAQSYLSKCIDLQPTASAPYANLGDVLVEMKASYDASLILQKGIEQAGPDYALLFNLARAYRADGNLDWAVRTYREAIWYKPSSEAYLHLAMCLDSIGNAHSALLNYIRSLRKDAGNTGALWGATLILTNSGLRERVDRYISTAITNCKPNNAARRTLLYRTQALLEKRRGKSPRYIYYLIKASNAAAKEAAYNGKNETIKADRLIRLGCHVAQFEGVEVEKKEGDPKLIFVVGMPRSGTSLVERILSCNPNVLPLGERGTVSRLIFETFNGSSEDLKYCLKQLRDGYLREVKDRSTEYSFIVDKMPFNYRFVPILLKAFPDAKVIHMNRDPAAVCWSCFTQSFSAKGLAFTNKLAWLVDYYSQYARYVEQWQSLQLTRYGHLSYEELAGSPTKFIPQLVRWLDFEWNDQYLHPERSVAPSATASKHQIRSPISPYSSEEWVQYRDFIGDAFHPLQKFRRFNFTLLPQ